MNNFFKNIKKSFIFPDFKPGMDYQEAQKFVLKWILNVAAILGIVTVVMAVFEALSLGQPNIAFQYILFFSPVIIAASLREKLGYKASVLLLIFSLILLSTSDIVVYGFSGAGVSLFISVFIFTTLFFGLKAGFLSILLSIFLMGIIGWLMMTRIISLNIDLMQATRNPISWITACILLSTLGSLMILSLGIIQNSLLASISTIKKQTETLQITNRQLNKDIIKREEMQQKLNKLNTQLEQKINERTKALKVAQEELIHNERLAVFGKLAEGVAHELRNPLGVIANAIYYLQTVNPNPDIKTEEYLHLIKSEVQRSTYIINDLFNYDRITTGHRELTNISRLMAQILSKNPAPQHIRIINNLTDDLPQGFIDPEQVNQIISNLLTNAYQAMPHEGSLQIDANTDGDFIALSFKDSGSGIPEQNMDKIFEPLFTTKARGIGLGLAIARRLAQVNDGSIEVQSQVGKGSTFTLRLPVRE